MKTCLRCAGELVTIETGNTEIKTQYCKECGFIENSFCSAAVVELNKKSFRVSEEGDIITKGEIEQ